MLLSCQLAAALAGVLLVVPSYLLGRSLFGRFPGFAAALMFQVLPVPAHVTSDGLAEALYLLCVVTSLGFGVRAVRHRSTLYFLLCGMAAGAAYLVRPEGLMVVLAVGVVVAGLGILRRWPRDVAAGRLAGLGVGVLLVATPYMVLIGGLTNKSTGNEILVRMLGVFNPKAEKKSLGTWDRGEAVPAGRPVLFASWYDPERDGSKAGWAATATATEVLKTAYYVPFGLAVVGLVLVRNRLFAQPELAVLPVLVVINLAVLFALGLKIGYVSERHTLLVVLIVCYFAAVALEPVARSLAAVPKVGAVMGGRYGAAGVLAAVVASALPAALRPLHENRAGHYHAGKFLEATVMPDDLVVDPFSWALFYSGRSLNHIPPDPSGSRVYYAVWENTKDNPHSRLPRREDALNIARDGWSVVAFHWPTDVPPARAKVIVYKLDGGTQDVARAVASGLVTPILSRPDPNTPRP
jgi:4-amino-4-deoxy-L-arabinose transferase-like glycosyltransferase